jgi:hypothetical protein
MSYWYCLQHQESDLRKKVSPDKVAAYECGVAAEARLHQLGLTNPPYLANIHPDLVKMAMEMVRIGLFEVAEVHVA